VTSSLHSTFSGSIPEYYDRCLGPAWFGPFGRELAALLPQDPGGDVLEIACGTGLVTRELRARLAPSRRLVASDLNKPMLDYARSKLGDRGIEWREADAQALPFREGEFAAVACALGFMFMPDKPKAFSQARRVLKRGGTLILSVWDRAEENDAARIYAETIEAMFPGDEDMRFRLPWAMHDESALRKLLADARFDVVRIEKKRLSAGDVDPRTIATGQVRGTPRGLLLERKGVSMDEAIERVTRAIEQHLSPPGARLHGQAILVEARAA
jgi:SAM-dependent methyltransferase